MDTKEEFDALYRFYVDRYFSRDHPEIAEDPAQTDRVVLHYHKFFMKPILENTWKNLQPILQIQSTDLVLVVGAGFGWGIEALVAESGATCVGVDVSTYIQSEKDNTEEAEIDAEIIAVGLNPTSGRGLAIKNYVYDIQARTNVVVLDEDMQTNQSRNAIRQALGNNWPTVCIVEDLITESTTDQEITQVQNALDNFAGTQRVIWISRDYPTRSLQQLQTLTGSEVIHINGLTHLVP